MGLKNSIEHFKGILHHNGDMRQKTAERQINSARHGFEIGGPIYGRPLKNHCTLFDPSGDIYQ